MPISCFVLILPLVHAAPGEIDPAFVAADGRVLTKVGNFSINSARKVLLQPDGKVVVIGTATGSFGAFTVVRYNPDGSLDTSFDGDGIVSTAFGIQSSNSRGAILQPDGKIIVVGEARENNTSGDDFGIIRYNSDGSLDSTFGTGGKVFTSFTPTSQDFAQDVALQSDGKIVVSGNTTNDGFAVARYNVNGSLDLSFGTGGKVTVAITNHGNNNNAIAIQKDGKIVLAGSVTINNPPQETQYLIGLARLTQNGSLDSNFDGDGKLTTAFGTFAICNDIQIQPDGKIVAIGGVSVDVSGALDFALLRYNSDGSLDGQFNGGGKVSTSIGAFDDKAWSVGVLPDGKIVLAGESRINSEDTDFALARYDSNGNLDAGFGIGGKVLTTVASLDAANSLALQVDGKVIVAGSSTPVATSSLIAVVRYNQNGSISQDFGFKVPGRTNIVIRGIVDEANAVVVQPDGRILSAGRSRVTNRHSFSLARQNPDGTLDQTFGINGTLTTKIGVGDTDSEARAIALQPDGKIIAAGRLYDANNGNQSLYYFAVARYNPDGSSDPTFDGDGIKIVPAPNEDNQAYSVAVQPDGKILIAGYNDMVPGNSSENFDMSVIRLNGDGSLDTTFDSDGTVTIDMGYFFDVAYSMKLQTDGKIVIGGVGLGATSGQDFAIVRLNSDGSLDSTFGTSGKVLTPVGTADEVRSILIQPDGKIVAVGSARVGLANDFAVVRYNPDGSLDVDFGSGGKLITPIAANAADNASAVVLQNDGKIVVTGTSTVTGNSNLAVVRYFSNGTLDAGFGTNGIVITDYGSFGNVAETAAAAALQSDGKLIVVGSMRDRTAVGISGDRRDFLTVRYLTNSPPPFDIDGDGKTDFGIFRPSNGTWYVLKSQNGAVEQFQFGADGDVPVDADFDGDFKADWAVWRPSTGEWFWRVSSNGAFGGALWGVSGDTPVPGDYDGDGKTDFAVWRPADGLNYIVKSTGGFLGIQWGTVGDIPSHADLNGDGKTDFVVFRPSNGTWYTLINGTNTTEQFQFGANGDIAVRGDIDGDGRGDIILWRPSTGEWFFRRSSNGTLGGIPWGATGDRPVPGDYDGDGRTDFGVWRSTNGIHYVVRNSGGFIGTQWGAVGDIPVLGSPLP